VIELPLLDAARRRQYELGIVVVVEAPTDASVARAVTRGLSEDDARQRMAAQPTSEERRAIADRVVANSSGLEELDAQVSELWDWLRRQRGTPTS
jgi:dephospho-CoA kinase